MSGISINSQNTVLQNMSKEEKSLLNAELGRLDKERVQISKLAEEFESIFLEMTLSNMRQTVAKSELVDGGQGEEIFRSMLDGEYAKSMANQRSSGIAQNIESQLVKIIDDQRQAIQKRLGISEYNKSPSFKNGAGVAKIP